MLSHLAASFPPLSLVLDVMQRHPYTVLGNPEPLESLQLSSQRGQVEAEL